MERSERTVRELSSRVAAWIILLPLMMALVSCNPFAPEIDRSGGNANSILSDQRTVEGVFANMRYAYTFKDTTIYGQLLTGDFTFSFRDYDKLIDDGWGRDDEMRITNQLFQNASSLNLTWNNIVGISGDSLLTEVTRSFNLTVTFNPSDMMRVDGKVSLRLIRKASTDVWKIVLWRDESNY